MIVVDTNVVSELMRATPADAVVGWIRARRAGELFTTAITVTHRFSITAATHERRNREVVRRRGGISLIDSVMLTRPHRGSRQRHRRLCHRTWSGR